MHKITTGLAPLTLALAALLASCGPSAPTAAAGGGGVAPTPVSFPSGSPAPTVFTDPTENGFTVSVPQGWTVKGGIQRATASIATPWVTATSPDGASVISIGDPSIPPFIVPSQIHPAGQQLQTASGVMGLVAPYESAAQFAQDYASRTFANTCQLQPMGSQPEPALVQAMQTQGAQLAAQVGITPAPAQFDGASATFGCQVNGVADVVGVMDVTTLLQSQVGSSWTVPLVVAYRTPAASVAQTDQLARAMRASLTPNPQWQAKMIAATRQQLAVIQQQGTAEQQQLSQMQAQQSAALYAQGQANGAALNAQHQATMDQLNQQAADRNAGVAQQQYDQTTQQQAELRYIGDQQCVQWYDAAHTRCAATAPN